MHLSPVVDLLSSSFWGQNRPFPAPAPASWVVNRDLTSLGTDPARTCLAGNCVPQLSRLFRAVSGTCALCFEKIVPESRGQLLAVIGEDVGPDAEGSRLRAFAANVQGAVFVEIVFVRNCSK
jgi:hypothetical protein